MAGRGSEKEGLELRVGEEDEEREVWVQGH